MSRDKIYKEFSYGIKWGAVLSLLVLLAPGHPLGITINCLYTFIFLMGISWVATPFMLNPVTPYEVAKDLVKKAREATTSASAPALAVQTSGVNPDAPKIVNEFYQGWRENILNVFWAFFKALSEIFSDGRKNTKKLAEDLREKLSKKKESEEEVPTTTTKKRPAKKKKKVAKKKTPDAKSETSDAARSG